MVDVHYLTDEINPTHLERIMAEENLVPIFQANPKVWSQVFTTNDATLDE